MSETDFHSPPGIDSPTPLSRLAEFAERYQKTLTSIGAEFLSQETRSAQRNLLIASIVCVLVLNGQLKVKNSDVKFPYDLTLSLSGTVVPQLLAGLCIYFLILYIVRVHSDWVRYSLESAASSLILQDLEEQFLPLPARGSGPGEDRSSIESNMDRAWGTPPKELSIRDYELRARADQLRNSLLNRDWLSEHAQRVRSSLLFRTLVDIAFPVLIGAYASVKALS